MKIENVLGDGIGYVHMLDHMGDDAEIVRRARVCYQSQEKSAPESDLRLLKKLVSSKPLHGTTIRGVAFTFDVVAPQFCLRQWTRHLIGIDAHGNDVWYTGSDSFDEGASFDEQSFRYTDKIQFYIPEGESKAAYLYMSKDQLENYNMLREYGEPKERARFALGSNVYSQMTWTVNAQAVLDFLSKRLPGGGAQCETSKYAEAVLKCVRAIIPETVKIWESER